MATGTIPKPTVSDVTLYQKSAYQNDVGSDCPFTESATGRFVLLVATLYVGSASASHRASIVIPNAIGAAYIPIMDGATSGHIRCGCDGEKLAIVSSSFASVWVASVVGYQIN